jgi:hypothetical protein
MGINLLWIGVESKADLFEKTKGIDLHALIKKLQDNGITVLASLILFLEHHDKENIHEEIDWAISMESDLLQFMQLGLNPGTPIYKEYDEKGKLMRDFPWKRRHGQDTIWFNHPNFTLSESSIYLRDAFRKKYEIHGPSIMNMAHTAVKGYLAAKKAIAKREKKKLVWNPEKSAYLKQFKAKPDLYMKLRLEAMKKTAMKYRPALKTMVKYSPNMEAAEKGRMIIDLFNNTFGPVSLKDRLMNFIVQTTAIVENLRFKVNGVIMRQPPVIRTVYKDRSTEDKQDSKNNGMRKSTPIAEPVNAAASVS